MNVATKRLKELKNLTNDELSVKIRETEALLFQTKMKQVTGQLGDTASLWRLRKDVSRMKTLQGQAAASAGKGSK
jgi:large subunit ribosomal protein L29